MGSNSGLPIDREAREHGDNTVGNALVEAEDTGFETKDVFADERRSESADGARQ